MKNNEVACPLCKHTPLSLGFLHLPVEGCIEARAVCWICKSCIGILSVQFDPRTISDDSNDRLLNKLQVQLLCKPKKTAQKHISQSQKV